MAFTKEQQQAIDTEGSNIIVSAGAGSGKTAVLTERVIRKLKSGVSVDRLLVLTFTNEAANEMKSRIRDEIISRKLDEQLGLLDSAYITTFDSFSLSIVKKYHYLLNIDSNISIVDSNIIAIYKYRVIDEIFENSYGDMKFDKLINDFCLKDDKSLKEYIINLSAKLDLLIDMKGYLDSYLQNYYNDDYLNNLVSIYENIIKSKILELKKLYEDFLSYATDNLTSKLDMWFKPLFSGDKYDDFILFNTFSPVRFTQVSEDGIKSRDLLKEKIAEIKNLLRFGSSDEIKDSILKTYDYVQVIIDIVLKLNEKVSLYKNKYQAYEFNDIAHMAIDVVRKNDDIRLELRDYFNEIMVDEYQDTSSIQEEFINLISNNNVYMVGDIKQSIYRFRNANPYIFQDKYDRYSKLDGGIKIDLLKNFRSRSETLFNINEIFNLIMDNEIGDAKYLEDHNMVYGNTAYDKEDTGVNNKLEIYNYTVSDDDEFTKEEKELFIISEDINLKIKNKYQVFDKKTGKLRDLRYSDICIITDRNKYLDKYKKILEYNGIPSVLYMDEVLTNDIVIMVIKNLISLVDYVNRCDYNDRFRYLLTSVARSFLFNYSDQEIYDLMTSKNYFSSNILLKCKEINVYEPLPVIINNIIDKFEIYDKLTNLHDIDKDLVRISNLIDIANNLSSFGYGITDFIEYLDDVIDKGLLVKYSVNTASSDSIKIMNIHKSKGLEFSLCYFTGMHNKFTIKEISSKMLVDTNYGIILPYLSDGELKDTILKDLYVYDYIKKEVSEKIRLFYVALTRCREKMIIVTSLDNNREGYNHLVPYMDRILYRSFLDILNSVSVIDKYVVSKSANYTHEYDQVRLKDISFSKSDEVIDKVDLGISYKKVNNNRFSKEVNKVFDKDEIIQIEYGSKIHEIFEYEDFLTSNNKYVKNLFSKISKNYINLYKEYEFSDVSFDGVYNGVIDLMLEYEDYINIIDYKLKNIDSSEYEKQLKGYKKYIEKITNKKVYIYLYSIADDMLLQIDK